MGGYTGPRMVNESWARGCSPHVAARAEPDLDRLLSAVQTLGAAPDRETLTRRVSEMLRELLGCDEGLLLEHGRSSEVVAGPLRAALIGHARSEARPATVSTRDLLGDHDGVPVDTWAVAPVDGGDAALVAGWRSRTSVDARRLRELGILAQWAGAALHITGRRERVDASVVASDEFVTAAAHELRTPLTPLRLTIDRASRALAERDDRERAKGALAKVDEHVRRMTDLVDTLLEASRVARGDLVLVRRETDLTAVAEEVVARHSVQARLNGCDLQLAASERVVGRWDAQRLREALSQIVLNAVKFGAGKPVHVEIHRDGGAAVVRVRDEGLGVAAAEHDRIFDRFERAVSVRNFGGLGVGLWLAQGLAKAHGGEVRVESAPDQGAVFTLSLPIRHRADPADRHHA